MEGVSPARALGVSRSCSGWVSRAVALAVPAVALLLLTGGTAPVPAAPEARTGVLAHGASTAHSGRTTGRWSGSIRVGSRSAVDSAYRRAFAPGLGLGTGYTGDD